MIELKTRGIGMVRLLEFLPDGRLFGYGVTGYAIWTLPERDAQRVVKVNAAAMRPSPDGKWVVVSMYSQPPCVESLTEPFQRFLLSTDLQTLHTMFTPDGQHLVGWHGGNVVNWTWWKVADWSTIAPPMKSPRELYPRRTHLQHPHLAFSADGQWVASCGSGPVLLGHLPTQAIEAITMPVDSQRRLIFHPNSQSLLIWVHSKLHEYDLIDRKIRGMRTGATKSLTDGVFTPCGRYFLAVSKDGNVYLMEMRSWTKARVYTWATRKIYAVAVSRDGLTAAISTSGKIIIWDLDL